MAGVRSQASAGVLVDAGDLDLAEKTLILFRHAKARGASGAARRLLRSTALSIVEHPHFTPERIRRFVTDRLEALPQIALEDGPERVRDDLERELASPTDAMRTSFRALESEHRELLIALLDAPAGLIDERELAATVRRHHAGGLSRPPGELIDRLTDHFLRVTPLGIGWVHPSWRDLVIDELREDTAARWRFLEACSLHGTMLALHGVRTAEIAKSEKWEARNLAAYLLNAIARGGTSGIGRCPCSWWRAGMRCANGLPGSSSHPRWASAGLSCTPDHLRPAGWTDSSERRWWEPEDIPTPPTTDPALTAPAQFTRQDVDRVLRDL